MKVNEKIGIALLPIVLIGSELLAQTPTSSLPNAPEAQSLPIASAQSRQPIDCQSPASGGEGTPS
jgi:hypothetical protein